MQLPYASCVFLGCLFYVLFSCSDDHFVGVSKAGWCDGWTSLRWRWSRCLIYIAVSPLVVIFSFGCLETPSCTCFDICTFYIKSIFMVVKMNVKINLCFLSTYISYWLFDDSSMILILYFYFETLQFKYWLLIEIEKFWTKNHIKLISYIYHMS